VKGRWILALSLLAATSLSSVRADSVAFRKKVLATPGLIGYWPFEDSLIDLTANANDARVQGNAASITFGPGINGGRALKIDNPDTGGNFVDVNSPPGSIFDAPKFSVITSAFLTKTADPASGDWNSVFDRNSLWYLSFEPVDDLGGQPGSRFAVRIYAPDNPAGGGTRQIKDDAFFTRKNVWHRYAFTYDGAQVVMYMDGKEVLREDYDGGVGATADTPAESPHNNYNLTWGAWQQRGDWFSGSIDDTAYFNRALTGDEIKALDDALMANPQ
jgi:concanavalin A-like lectin/glucanase superfamily protein